MNISEGGESSNIAHDKEQTTVLLKHKYFDTHLQRAHKSPSTTHFTQCKTAQTKTKISREATVAFTTILQKVHLFARASEQSEYNTLA